MRRLSTVRAIQVTGRASVDVRVFAGGSHGAPSGTKVEVSSVAAGGFGAGYGGNGLIPPFVIITQDLRVWKGKQAV